MPGHVTHHATRPCISNSLAGKSNVKIKISGSKIMDFLLIAALLIFSSSKLVAAASQCPVGTFNENGKCCKLCPAGTYLVSPCLSNNSESVCDTCKNGTFRDTPSNERACEKCKRCQPSQIVTSACRSTKNTECRCRPGKYFDAGLLYCMDCRVCKKGYGAWKACSTDGNTDCRPCAKGTFSDSESMKESCKKCSVCGPGHDQVAPCTAFNNTECIKVNQTGTSTTKSSPAPSRGTSHRPSSDREWIIPLISVMFVVLFLLLVVGGWHYRRTLVNPCRRDSESCGSHDIDEDTDLTDQEFAIPMNSVEEQTPHASRGIQHGGLRGRHKSNGPRRTNRDSNDSQGSTGSLQGDRARTGKVTLVRELPATVIESIAMLLNPSSKNDWAKLAAALGYSSLEISNWRLVPLESTQRLLQDWQTRDTSTTEKLYRTLTNIKRDDAAVVLSSYR